MIRRLFIALLIPVLAGCASYRPGPPQGLTQSVWVAPVVNRSFLPQADSAVANKVRDTFAGDTAVPLASEIGATAHLEITLTDVSREGRAYGQEVLTRNSQGAVVTESDTGMARAFDVTLHAHVRLVDAASGDVLLEQDFAADAQTHPDPYSRGEADQERELLPVIARELARQIHDAVASGWAPQQDR